MEAGHFSTDELLALGEQLKAVRLERGLSLQEVAEKTRIRQRFLEGFEVGRPDPSLTPVQVSGFLRNYATYLHLDLDAMLLAYRHALANSPKSGLFRKKSQTPPPSAPLIPIRGASPVKTPPQALPKVPTSPISTVVPPVGGGFQLSLLTGLGGLLVLGLALGAGFTLLNLLGSDLTQAESTRAPAPLVIQVNTPTVDPKGGVTLAPSLTPTASSPSAAGFLIPTLTPLGTTAALNLEGASGLSLSILAVQRSWVRVVLDGQVAYEGILRPDTQLDNLRATESITLRTANAGGLEVLLNNQPLGVLGGRGQLYEQTFTLAGLALSTPNLPPGAQIPQTGITPSPSPLATLIPENTLASPPSATPAPLPSATLIPDGLPPPIPAPPILATPLPLGTSAPQLTATALATLFGSATPLIATPIP